MNLVGRLGCNLTLLLVIFHYLAFIHLCSHEKRPGEEYPVIRVRKMMVCVSLLTGAFTTRGVSLKASRARVTPRREVTGVSLSLPRPYTGVPNVTSFKSIISTGQDIQGQKCEDTWCKTLEGSIPQDHQAEMRKYMDFSISPRLARSHVENSKSTLWEIMREIRTW
jgi:hypothetical protein